MSYEQDKQTVNLGEKLRAVFKGQIQYLVRYFDKAYSSEYQYLGDGLRIEIGSGDYQDISIHQDDLDEAIRRLRVVLDARDQKPPEKPENDDIPPPFLPDWAK